MGAHIKPKNNSLSSIKHFEKSLDIWPWQTPISSLFHGFISHMVHYSCNNYAIIHFLIVFSNTLNFHEFSKIVRVVTTRHFFLATTHAAILV